jgi:hypothetical protein
VKEHGYGKLNSPNGRSPAASREPRKAPKPPQDNDDKGNEAGLLTRAFSFVPETNDTDYVPQTMGEAKSSPEWLEWKQGIQVQYSLTGMSAWELVDLPEGRTIIESRWVFDKKNDGERMIARYKARLVAQGFSQQPGMDHFEKFAPVLRHDSLRAMLAIGAIRDMEIMYLDLKGTYLNGDLEEEPYM